MKRMLFLLLLFALSVPEGFAAEELVVYSARKEHLVKPLFEAYEQKTGVKIKYVTDKAGVLLQKLKAEGENTPADILMTVDAGNLWQASREDLLASLQSSILESNIPASLRDSEGRWFGLSVRARTIVYSTERVQPEELSTYEDLGNEEWSGRLCLRTSKKVYNQSLIAMMIAEKGIPATESVVSSWIRNLAAPVFSNDTKVMKAIEAGQCDVGIVNSYYFGRLQKKNPEIALALFWPNQQSSGVHVNVSGAGVVKYSKKEEQAAAFLEWLSSEEAQNLFADSNMEFPANSKVEAHPSVKAWGDFKANDLNLALAGKLQKDAVQLMDRMQYQ